MGGCSYLLTIIDDFSTLGENNGRAAVQRLRFSKNAALNSEGLRLAQNPQPFTNEGLRSMQKRSPLSNKGLRFLK